MSDQDFFFDEEDEKPARGEKASGSKSPGRKPSGTTPASASKAPAAAAPVAAGSVFEQSLNVGVASLLVVIALLLGVAVGIFVGESRANSALLTDVPAVTNTGGASAPALSQDQLNSGQLPAGHPSIGTTGSTSATGK